MVKEVIHSYNKNKQSLRVVGNIYGINRHEVRKILIDNNIHIRNNSEAQSGKKLSNEHKRKLSNAHKGKKLTKEHINNLKGRTPHNKGVGDTYIICKNCKKNTKIKLYRNKVFCSNECKNEYNKKNNGIKHFNYKGKELRGVQTRRNWAEYKLLKKQVHSRDEKCLSCKSNINLEAHHIKSWSSNIDERFNIHNVITLCKICHRKLHDYCGQKKINMDKQMEWLDINLTLAW